MSQVFLDYDQDELDRAYDQQIWAPNRDAVITRNALASEAVRARIGSPLTFAYGPTAVETLDVYRTECLNAPVMILLHGGAWRSGSARDYAFAAETFVKAGAHHVVPDFATAMDVGLDGMVAQVRRAVAWVRMHAADFGADPERLYLAGHSSGAHLAACALTRLEFPKSALLVSGVYDLLPVRLSARNEYLRIDEQLEHEYSPIRHVERIKSPVTVAWGENEGAEFFRQSKEFAQKLGAPTVVGGGLNHFEMIETLADPRSPLARAALTMLR